SSTAETTNNGEHRKVNERHRLVNAFMQKSPLTRSQKDSVREAIDVLYLWREHKEEEGADWLSRLEHFRNLTIARLMHHRDQLDLLDEMFSSLASNVVEEGQAYWEAGYLNEALRRFDAASEVFLTCFSEENIAIVVKTSLIRVILRLIFEEYDTAFEILTSVKPLFSSYENLKGGMQPDNIENTIKTDAGLSHNLQDRKMYNALLLIYYLLTDELNKYEVTILEIKKEFPDFDEYYTLNLFCRLFEVYRSYKNALIIAYKIVEIEQAPESAYYTIGRLCRCLNIRPDEWILARFPPEMRYKFEKRNIIPFSQIAIRSKLEFNSEKVPSWLREPFRVINAVKNFEDTLFICFSENSPCSIAFRVPNFILIEKIYSPLVNLEDIGYESLSDKKQTEGNKHPEMDTSITMRSKWDMRNNYFSYNLLSNKIKKDIKNINSADEVKASSQFSVNSTIGDNRSRKGIMPANFENLVQGITRIKLLGGEITLSNLLGENTLDARGIVEIDKNTQFEVIQQKVVLFNKH
ncbi:MAG: hypothetical protein QW728_05455, partial [Thermoplasmata archaeon]